MKEKIFCIPRMGNYTTPFVDMLKALNLNMLETPQITEKTIKIGVKHSPEMICYPFKITLGTFIECIEKGATDLIIYNSGGVCRFRQYHKMQELIIRQLGYDFNMHTIKPRTLIFDIKKLNKKNSYFSVLKEIMKCWNIIKIMEDNYHSKIDRKYINIGVIGEVYTVLEPKINGDVINKIKKYNVRVHTFLNIRHLIKSAFGLEVFRFREAKSYLDGQLGGHSVHNIKDALYFTRNGIDGIVHIMPITCMPESTIEPILNKICYDAKVPLLRLGIDETNSELNFNTRLETFIELIKRKREG